MIKVGQKYYNNSNGKYKITIIAIADNDAWCWVDYGETLPYHNTFALSYISEYFTEIKPERWRNVYLGVNKQPFFGYGTYATKKEAEDEAANRINMDTPYLATVKLPD